MAKPAGPEGGFVKAKLFLTGKAGFMALMLVALTLSGCGLANPAPAATQDPAVVVEMVVATVDAQMTEEALRNPSPTPPPTSTPLPTATATLEPTATPAVTNTPAMTDTPVPTDTPVVMVSAQVLYTTTYPENRREYVPNELFSLAVGVKNTGTIPWGPGYTMKLVSFEGEVTCAPEVVLGKGVDPGAKAEFDFWAFGSETLGKHVWNFQLYNAAGGAIPGGYASFSYTSH